jgi:4-hydroxybenzoate polyprenyltransferase
MGGSSKPFEAYGGIHTGAWVNRLPAPWVPYVQLARLSPPAPLFLMYFPHLYGVICASILRKATGYSVVLTCLQLDSKAAHSARRNYTESSVNFHDVPSSPGRVISYRLATSHDVVHDSHFHRYRLLSLCQAPDPMPPAGSRFCLAWGVTVGMAVMDVDPLATVGGPCLVAACTLWAVIYDTIYACLDVNDDIRLSLGSLRLESEAGAVNITFLHGGLLERYWS